MDYARPGSVRSVSNISSSVTRSVRLGLCRAWHIYILLLYFFGCNEWGLVYAGAGHSMRPVSHIKFGVGPVRFGLHARPGSVRLVSNISSSVIGFFITLAEVKPA